MDYLAGLVLQYLRARKSFPEWAAATVLVVVSGLGYWLTTEHAFQNGARGFILGMIQWGVHMLGASQGTSILANIAVAGGANPNNPLMPVTKQ